MEEVITRITAPSGVAVLPPIGPNRTWGPLFAGLVVITGAGWLLMVLGSALGVTILVEKDTLPEAGAIGWSAILWFIASWVIAFFLGGMLTTRLMRMAHKTGATLYSITLWGLGVTAALVIGAVGVGGVLATAQGLLKGAGSVTQGVAATADAATDTSAIGTLRTSASRELEIAVKRGTRDALNRGTNGQPVDPKTVDQAIAALDGPTLISAAAELLADRKEGAKNVLQLKTNLTDAQIDQILNATDAKAAELRAKLKEAAETVSEYTALVLWLAFVGGAIALVATILGGRCGASVVRRRADPMVSNIVVHEMQTV